MTREVLVAVLVTLIVGDAARSSRWGAARLARWAAWHIYIENGERAAKRAEEWEALAIDSLPSDISAFCFGMSVAAWAGVTVSVRHAAVWLPRIRMGMHGRYERRLAEHRKARLALLAAAYELRLLATDAAGLRRSGMTDRLPQIRRQAADAQLQAVNVALLCPAAAESAQRLAKAVGRFTDPVAQASWQESSSSLLLDLDESITTFRYAAVAVSCELSRRAGIHIPATGGDASEF